MNLLKIEYRHISEHGFALFCAKYRGTGWKSPTQKRHCECGKGSFRRKGAATRKKAGKAKATVRQITAEHKVRIFGSNLRFWLSQAEYM